MKEQGTTPEFIEPTGAHHNPAGTGAEQLIRLVRLLARQAAREFLRERESINDNASPFNHDGERGPHA